MTPITPKVELQQKIARAMFDGEADSRKSGWTWEECSPIEVEGWMELAGYALDALAANKPVIDEAMAKDAERYRWLRLRLASEELDSEDAALIALRMVGPIGRRPADSDYNGELDEAIDAALAAALEQT